MRPIVVVVIAMLGFGTAAAAAEPPVLQGGSVSTCAGELVASQGGPVSPAEPSDSRRLALDKLAAADVSRMEVGAAALCPAQLPVGFKTPSQGATPSGASSSCKSARFGNVVCVTCCTCVVAGGQMQCDCATDCIEVF